MNVQKTQLSSLRGRVYEIIEAGKPLIPKGNIRLLENDQIVLYSHIHIPDSQLISV